ncbi:MAG: methylmalonyl Co-A mutase-associated GTPase MeaB [Desulfobacteraceae bacterium]|nr:methylmalonyl Co-A mutase-associated GTPase MeaB [Desulfobacteraceae bacterium]MBU4000837.1 methylmalonyl Co-A mutase-associated GTPase MeaB [Pseudomonadota bacterium]MBU4052874.1 methylmalonyl Co-A mutase-associated GTPase MeaB [Pseudomonadota bacterium]
MDVQTYIDGILAKNRRMLAKTITLVESTLPEHQALASSIVEKLLPRTGKAIRLGITGVPGAGKSLFIESLGLYLLQQGLSMAVLAVDPSSRKSGGSILADKTRMEKLCREEQVFIRPSPSGGALGGVAAKTRETLLICEAFGFDVVIVETVGVGQSETTVASMVDFFLVLMLAGAGDELQGLKKGILELADAVAINKADGDNLEKAREARHVYDQALALLTPASRHWRPPVLTCSALTSAGIPEIWNTVLACREKLSAAGEFQIKRQKQALDWMWAMVHEGLKSRFDQNEGVKKNLPKILDFVERGLKNPSSAALELLFFLDNKTTI